MLWPILNSVISGIAVYLATKYIRDGGLYQQDYGSFDAYCRQRWELSRSHADRLIVAAQRVRQLGELAPMGVILGVVLNERQARRQAALVSGSPLPVRLEPRA